MSRLSPLSFPAASPKDVGAGARGGESTLPGLENSLVLSKLGEGAPVGQRLRKLCCGAPSLRGCSKRHQQ